MTYERAVAQTTFNNFGKKNQCPIFIQFVNSSFVGKKSRQRLFLSSAFLCSVLSIISLPAKVFFK
jgi:hypothetical protein